MPTWSNIRRVVTFIAGAVMLIVVQGGKAQEVTADLLANFEREFIEEMNAFNVPGAAVAIVQNGDIVYAKGFGVRNLETGEPVTTATVFRVASLTKAMTSLMIATLVDEGVLAWDTPAVEIYPDFKLPTDELTQSTTLRELMGMGTGLASNILPSYWDEYSATDLLAALATFPVLGKKGETYFYNNEVYSSAGYLAALATKPGEQDLLEVYKSLMQTRVFDAIGMDVAVLTEDPATVSDDYAASYSFSLVGGPAANERVPYAALSAGAPAGAVVTDVMEIARFLITQLNEGVNPEGVRVVSAENLAETWRLQTPLPDVEGFPDLKEVSYAAGWFRETYGDVNVLRHAGDWDGFNADMLMVPDAEAGIVILANSSLGESLSVIMRYRFIEQLYSREPTVSEQLSATLQGQLDELSEMATRFPTSQVETAAVQGYLGDYAHGWRLERRDDGTLWLLRPGWELQLLPTPDGFVVSSGVALGAQISFEGDKPTLLLTVEGTTAEIPRH